MKIKMSPIQLQKQALAPFLRQSIEVLMLPAMELSAAIEQELQDNPLLEPEDHELHQRFKALEHSLPRVPASAPAAYDEEDAEPDALRVEDVPTLAEHLIRQLHLEMADPAKRRIGEFIIGNLDDEGYFTMPVEEAAAALALPDTHILEQVLKAIQVFEPSGAGARNLRDRLIIQLQTCDHPAAPLAVRIIQEHFHLLGEKKLAAITKALKTSVDLVQEAAALIATLNPKLNSRFQSGEPNLYVQPDVFIRKDPSGQLIVDLNRSSAPVLRVNQVYFNYLKKPNIPESEKAFIKEKLHNAINFIKSVQQRGETLRGISQYIADRQRGFLEGECTSILPMTMKEVSQHLERNESTVSRAISNKYVDTPVGLYPLKFFFSQAVFEGDQKDVSTHSIKEEIRGLVEEEDKESPLSDLDIQNHFKSKGLKLARRTINKYRQALDIPSSHRRKTG